MFFWFESILISILGCMKWLRHWKENEYIIDGKVTTQYVLKYTPVLKWQCLALSWTESLHQRIQRNQRNLVTNSQTAPHNINTSHITFLCVFEADVFSKAPKRMSTQSQQDFVHHINVHINRFGFWSYPRHVLHSSVPPNRRVSFSWVGLCWS